MRTTALGCACARSVEGAGDAIELGGGILDEDLLDDPPHGSPVSNVVVEATGHARMEHGEPVAVASEDKGARIAMVGEIARGLTSLSLGIIVHHDLPGLDPELVAGVPVHTRVASQGKIGGIAVFSNDIERLTVLILGVWIEDEATRESTRDGELEVGRDGLALASGVDRPEEIFEFAGGELVT